MPTPVTAPDARLVNRRWSRTRTIEWAEECNEIIDEHGAVKSAIAYDTHTKARWYARKLIDTLDRLTSARLGRYTYGDSSHLHAATSIGSAYSAATMRRAT